MLNSKFIRILLGFLQRTARYLHMVTSPHSGILHLCVSELEIVLLHVNSSGWSEVTDCRLQVINVNICGCSFPCISKLDLPKFVPTREQNWDPLLKISLCSRVCLLSNRPCR